jgi:hypothetical protein
MIPAHAEAERNTKTAAEKTADIQNRMLECFSAFSRMELAASELMQLKM